MTITKSSGNVFKDIGFVDPEAEVLAAKADLASLVARAIKERGLTQVEASKLCNTEQGTLSKILSGKLTSVTIDRLARYLLALGSNVKIDVTAAARKKDDGVEPGEMHVTSG